MSVSQQTRHISITTGLGTDALALNRFTLRDTISSPFEIEADLSSTDGMIDHDKAIGHPATIKVELGGDKLSTRYYCGYIRRLVQVANSGPYARYRANIVPWFWFLTRSTDCRIFQRLNVVEIVENVLNSRRFGTEYFDPRTQGAHNARRYCVQYRESDFNFISRLLESEGIYYWFENDKEQHKLILGDSIGASNPSPGFEEIRYSEHVQEMELGHHYITDWVSEKQLQPVAYQLKDFDFKKPSEPLAGYHEMNRNYGMARFAVYDYPGEYYEANDADYFAQLRLEELQSRYEVVRGKTNAYGLSVGNVFTLTDHPRSDQNRKYLITGLSLSADAGDYNSGGDGSEFWSCSFTAIPADVAYRPARLSPKPIVQGLQTATVVGPKGEEIYTDEHARVKVRFHWDMNDEIGDDDRTCFIRVAQHWAGQNWGAIQIPRIGQEVIVEFIEGDPDRPIITGRVYNGEQVPPYTLPANKTQSGIKSRSTMGGGGENFNEIRFEDKKGNEEVYIHAEKDQNNVVENDETTEVGHDRSENVGNDETITIGNDRKEDVGNNENIKIGNNRDEQVGVNESIAIGSNRSETVGANETISIAISRTRNVGVNDMINVGAAQEITVGAIQAITVGANQETKVGVNQNSDVGANRDANVGKNDTLKVGKKLLIEAGDEITIKTGKSSIVMKKDGTIQIKGKDISIEGSGKINVKASKDVVVKGKKILQN